MIIGKLPFKSDMLRELNKVAAKQGISAGTVQVMGSLRRARLRRTPVNPLLQRLQPYPFERLRALLAAGVLAPAALAQAATEISFFYPVAVGGPITKIIDGYAADFEKENPGIKVKPVYAGTYQETLVKAITAHKAGTPPTTLMAPLRAGVTA